MKLSHSISVTMFVSALAALPGCSDEAEPDNTGNGGTGTGGSGVSGAAGSGVSGSGVGGSGVSGSGGSGGSATGGAAGSGMAGSGTSGSGAMDHPTDTSQAGIEAYLMMELYKGALWRPEAMPGDDAALPHLATNRYFNETIIASKAAGNRPPSMGQHTAGSMSVKEILDGTTVIGKAATLRTETGMNLYYCKASVAGRCATNSVADMAYYGTGIGTSSCACHGSGTNTSHDAIPAP